MKRQSLQSLCHFFFNTYLIFCFINDIIFYNRHHIKIYNTKGNNTTKEKIYIYNTNENLHSTCIFSLDILQLNGKKKLF